MRPAYKKVMLRIKEVKAQKELTYQDIVDACESQNEAISLSTVKRLFAKGSEDGPDCRLSTINALFHAVIGTEDLDLSAEEEAALTETEKEFVAENSALKAVVEMRDATIEDLQSQIAALKDELAALEASSSATQIKLDTTTDLFRLAMESLGKSASR